MKKTPRNIVLILLVVGACLVLIRQTRKSSGPPLPEHTPGMPRLLDLGAHGCKACEMLKPVLAELKKEYEGRLQVDFIDVWIHEEVVDKYGINLIPVQIFYDAAGRELARHEGFISRDEIVAKFNESGVAL